jgi:hypothetical protein
LHYAPELSAWQETVFNNTSPCNPTISLAMTRAHTVPSKPRARLTQDQAVDIFKKKSSALTAQNIAVTYGISEKAIRDIWTGRTWSRETCHLDTARIVVQKQIGRPKGCRDQKPRKKRVVAAFDVAPVLSTLLPAIGVPRQIFLTLSSLRCDARVDEQLDTWNETLWMNSQNPDPFRDDWAPVSYPCF